MGRGRTRWLFPSLLGSGLALLPALAAPAQTPPQNQGLVVRDGTIGTPRIDLPPAIDSDGVVLPGPDDLGTADYLIRADLGEQHGGNLFHSFARFSIGSGERATFTNQGAPNPGAIDNVISRVTGGVESRIDGTLHSTIPGADVWLLNPSGVVFGEGAQLDVPGSFHASTGDYLGFGEGDLVRFYADPSRPSVLSTAPPAAFGFLGETGAASLEVDRTTLRVDPGETLELVGDDVSLTGAGLLAPGGLVSLEAQGSVALTGSLVDVGVNGGAPGAVSIRAGRLVMTEGSQVLAENKSTLPVPPDEPGPGSISIAASESVLVDDGLLSVNTSSAGNAGTIRVESPEVTFQNGPGLANFYEPSDPSNLPHRVTVGARAETTGSGRAGTLEVDADSLTVTAGAGLSAQTVGPDGSFASGAGGVIDIRAGSVLVSDLGFATVESWRSTGDAGSIAVHSDTLTIDAARADGLGSYPTTLTASSLTRRFVIADGVLDLGPAYAPGDLALGEPGTIEIEARSFHIRNGGAVESRCIDCVTRAGNVRVVVDEMIAEGRERTGVTSRISADTAGPAARGGGGLIDVSAGSLVLRNAYLIAATRQGAANEGGLIRVHADRVEVLGGGGIGGDSFAEATGDACSVEIHADSALVIENGGFITADTTGPGDAGNITIDADSVVVSDQGLIRADTAGEGRGGNIVVNARTLLIERQGILHAGSGGLGAAGTIDVTASESILVNGTGDPRFSLLRIVDAVNAGANPEITGIFSANGSGSITLEAPVITLTDGALVLATTGRGDAGDVFLSGDRIYVRNGAFVDSTSLVPGGNVGNVRLEAQELIEVTGSRVGEDEDGVPFEDPSRVTSASLGSGEGGTVALRAPRILIDGGAVATTALPSLDGSQGASGGNIRVNAGELIVRGGGRIDASSFIAGQGGNIDVIASDSIVVEGKASDGIASGISSRAGADGLGGAVTLRAPVIEVSGEISAKSEADPNFVEEVGTIFDSLIDDGVWIGTPPSKATGPAGSVTLAADKLHVFGGTIATNAEAADGGDVTIEARQLVHLDAGVITAAVRDGAGGNITIDPEVVILQNGSQIVANAGAGSGGNIQITADNYFAFPGTVVDASSDLGIDGIVEVHAPDVDLAGKIAALPTNFLDAASLMRERCAARRSGERAGSFAVRGNGGIPAEPDGWLPASASLEPIAAPAAPAEGSPPAAAAIVHMGRCR